MKISEVSEREMNQAICTLAKIAESLAVNAKILLVLAEKIKEIRNNGKDNENE